VNNYCADCGAPVAGRFCTGCGRQHGTDAASTAAQEVGPTTPAIHVGDQPGARAATSEPQLQPLRLPQLNPDRPPPGGGTAVRQGNDAYHSDAGHYWWSPNDRDWRAFGAGEVAGAASDQVVRGADGDFYTQTGVHRWDEAIQRYVPAAQTRQAPSHQGVSASARPSAFTAHPRSTPRWVWWAAVGVATVVLVIVQMLGSLQDDGEPTAPADGPLSPAECADLFYRGDAGDEGAMHQWDVECGRGF
jgi:hypothetical protein